MSNESESLEVVLQVVFFISKNLSAALFIVQKIKKLLVMIIKVIIFSMILFFFQVLCVPDRLNVDCAR